MKIKRKQRTITEYFDENGKIWHTSNKEYESEYKTVCDICKRESNPHEDGWADDCYETLDTKIEIKIETKEGTRYPEGGREITLSWDICPWCFKEHLIPKLNELGCTTNEKEVDW